MLSSLNRKLKFESLEERELLSTSPFEVEIDYRAESKYDVFDIIGTNQGRGAMWAEYFSDNNGQPGELINSVESGDDYWMAIRCIEWSPYTIGFGGFAVDARSSEGIEILDVDITEHLPFQSVTTSEDGNNADNIRGLKFANIGKSIGDGRPETFAWLTCRADEVTEETTITTTLTQGISRIAPTPVQSWGSRHMNYPISFEIVIMPTIKEPIVVIPTSESNPILPDLDSHWRWQPLIVESSQIGSLLDQREYPVYVTSKEDLPKLFEKIETPTWIFVDEVFSREEKADDILPQTSINYIRNYYEDLF
jgi:hypothetical protein